METDRRTRFGRQALAFSKTDRQQTDRQINRTSQANRSLAGFRNATRSLPRAVQSIMGSYTHTLHWMRASIDPGRDSLQLWLERKLCAPEMVMGSQAVRNI